MHLAGFCTGTALDFSWSALESAYAFEEFGISLQYVVMGELAFLLTNFFSLHLVIPRMRAFRVYITCPFVCKRDINAKELESNGVIKPNDRVALIFYHEEFASLYSYPLNYYKH